MTLIAGYKQRKSNAMARRAAGETSLKNTFAGGTSYGWYNRRSKIHSICFSDPIANEIFLLQLKTHSDPMWRDMHILQRPEPSTRPSVNSPSPSPPLNNLHFGPRRIPANRELEHLHDHSLLPNHFITHQLQRVWAGDAVNAKGLTYSIFNPDQLQFVSIYSKKPSTNYGILGIGLEGVVEMGAVVVGSVPDENEIEDGRVATLVIDGMFACFRRYFL
jgi:hypothetical protein